MIVAVEVSNTLMLAYPMYFLIGVCYVGRYFGGFCMIIEYSEPKYKTLLGTFLLTMDSISAILVILTLKVFKDVAYVEVIGLSINVLGVIGLLWLPETPEFLYNTMRFKRARAVFKKIAKTNRVKDYESEFLFDSELEMMRCKLSELTADRGNLSETRLIEKKY